MRTYLLTFALILLSVSACTSPIAQLGVTTIDGDGATVIATINFTDFVQPSNNGGNDNNLRLDFSNTEGDSMSFVIAPKNPSGGTAASLFPIGTYGIDQISSTFNASFTTASGTIEVTADPGFDNYINIQSIAFASNGEILSIQADFAMNFKEGGAGSGTMNVAF